MVLDFGILLVIFSLGPTQKKKTGQTEYDAQFCLLCCANILMPNEKKIASHYTKFSWEISKNAKYKFVILIDKVKISKHASTITRIRPTIPSVQ